MKLNSLVLAASSAALLVSFWNRNDLPDTINLAGNVLTTRPMVSKVPELSGGHAVYEFRVEKDTLWLTMIYEYAADGSQAPWVGNISFPLKLVRLEQG